MSLRRWDEHVVPRMADGSSGPATCTMPETRAGSRGGARLVRPGGCHLRRDVPALVASNGWQAEDMASVVLPGPAVARPRTYVQLGTATTA